ncbi:MAG: aspartate ammonia-lyase [Dehalococcoidia bacterium]|nr:aspartate ammonia-lyase [Dehalococcoidia bacterium]
MTSGDSRTERDSMGEMQVPVDAYYGASTMRAVLNFPISDLRFPRAFLRALGLIKLAGARVNRDLGLLSPEVAGAIEGAAREVADGAFDSHFAVDVFQSGSGTSTNMNANEVIGRRATELLNSETRIHPNDDVNLGQSSNDVIPAAIRIAALLLIEEELRPALIELGQALEDKAQDFWDVIKTARTHLQDATPIRLGQEFRGYAGQVERGLRRLDHAREELSELPLGGTAAGTGINAHPEFGVRISAALTELTGMPLRETDNHFQAQSNIDALVEASGVLRTIAISLMKIADDVRWMGSGPRAGLGELTLPEVQPGSSIMPGKVNPVIAESLLQVCAQVIGNDAAISVAGQGSHFELNMMLPVAAHNLLQSIELLAAGSRNFRQRCILGLEATQRGPELVDAGLGMATALAPHIGYDAAAAIAKEAASTGETVRQVAERRTKLAPDELDRVLDPVSMVQPGLEGTWRMPGGG